jgi:hypothetical protein
LADAAAFNAADVPAAALLSGIQPEPLPADGGKRKPQLSKW